MYRGQTGNTERYLRELDAWKATWERERAEELDQLAKQKTEEAV